jgi:alpha-ketoglutarate-dependent dioxygenase FTO
MGKESKEVAQRKEEAHEETKPRKKEKKEKEKTRKRKEKKEEKSTKKEEKSKKEEKLKKEETTKKAKTATVKKIKASIDAVKASIEQGDYTRAGELAGLKAQLEKTKKAKKAKKDKKSEGAVEESAPKSEKKRKREQVPPEEDKKKTKKTKKTKKKKEEASAEKKIRQCKKPKSAFKSAFDWKLRSKEHPPRFDQHRGPERYLTTKHPLFQKLVSSCYRGFVREPATEVPEDIHSQFRSVLAVLDAHDVFQYDVTQPLGLGTACARTYVTRTLIGKPGITYKYLGLRIFAHPWSESGEGGEGGESGESGESGNAADEIASACGSIRDLNSTLCARADGLQDGSRSSTSAGSAGPHGSSRFNLTLINRMMPSCKACELKPEATYHMGKTSVSWHADSSLQVQSIVYPQYYPY